MLVQLRPRALLTVELLETLAKRQFKKLLGRTNHDLITLLVGLDAIKTGYDNPGEEFSASWNLHNPPVSTRNARSFALAASLSWCVDSLDAYLVLGNRTPAILPLDLRKAMNETGRSVAARF